MSLPPFLRFTWLAALICCATAASATAPTTAEILADRIMDVSDSLVKARLAAFGTDMMEHRHDRIVRRRIVNYIERWPGATGRMLARSARYFPIFEEQLDAAGMPRALKYVAIQESALRPYATSRVGAGGLWQLMPGTARELGLTVSDQLDERLDPERGCAAGLQYLRYQYDRYEDWSLAIAAYNCGPGNVNKAIRKSGKKNPSYWQIREHLPGETAHYIPSIIAAVYIMAYYHDHDVPVGEMELDMQVTESITVYRKLSLHRVAQVTGLKPENVVELNPQYLRGFLPGGSRGHHLRLPQRVMPAMRTYLAKHAATVDECDIALPWSSPRLHAGKLDADRHYVQYGTVASYRDTTLRQVAEQNRIPVDQLAIWSNRGELDSLHEFDPLIFYRVAEYQPYDPRDRNTPVAAVAVSRRPLTPVRTEWRTHYVDVDEFVQPTPPKTQKTSFTDLIKGWFN
ncbi:lytic transglycosylase domain-containing protein [Neolewinella antarctica]|uniref:Membrane-bound lytic murein transglycosylase D n=1 Tax=Neolewinella antarctica TaxID=442734 RepID=A0ABX0XF03_9BACT|nr:lytic transglycosylase domain-containing protein [Neolewinella antarctica]NJC27471.1 membrane-bound lytic murein transglycosylase D [Neolewinella antarctica]